MTDINFKNAYYIKLGRNGIWEESSIKENKIRFGWTNISLTEINDRNWNIIKDKIQKDIKDQGAATRDYNALKSIIESTEEDIWITFHSSKLWWCKLGESKIYEDNISKYRIIKDKWQDCDIKGRPLIINQLPGKLTKTQRFAGTDCQVEAKDELNRVLNDRPCPEFQKISESKTTLINAVANGLSTLHWKDFEILVDLIFRNSGWRRISLLGKAMKYVDMELEEPITGDLYQVQVKSSAAKSDFEEYLRQFSSKGYRKLYFVVHSPAADLNNYRLPMEKNVELILPNRLAGMVVELGLIDWLMQKIR